MTHQGEDPEYQFSVEEQKVLTENLHILTQEVHSGSFSGARLDMQLLQHLHARIFSGVRDHAGKTRSRNWGSEHLVFGPNRSVNRTQVDEKLDTVFVRLERECRSLLADTQSPLFVERAFSLAVTTHADVIRIHPFQDGNGRTSRVLLNIMMVRFGLPPLAVEQCKQEYVALLNTYFMTRDAQPLIDGLLRVLHAQLVERGTLSQEPVAE
ncbi:MAG: Fic family protein [Polyangiaceae bacterium]